MKNCVNSASVRVSQGLARVSAVLTIVNPLEEGSINIIVIRLYQGYSPYGCLNFKFVF